MKFKRLLSIMLCGFPMFAQLQSLDSLDALKELTLDEMVISANKTEETKKSIAQHIQTLNSKEIEKIHAQSTADLISKIGIPVQMSQMGGGSPTLRGFEANRILLVVDGIRMNNMIYRSGHLQDIIKTDNNALDRIEILFGPSSTIYGSDALGGVIHLYTKKPKLAIPEHTRNISLEAMMRYATVNNEWSNHVGFNYGKQRFASYTAFSYKTFGDLVSGKNKNMFYRKSYWERPSYVERINGVDSIVNNENRFKQVYSGYSQFDITQKLLFKQNDQTKHTFNLQYSESTDIPRYDRLTDVRNGNPRFAEWYYGPQIRLLSAYNLSKQDLDATIQNMQFSVNYQKIKESRHNRNFRNELRSNRYEHVDVFGANLDFQKYADKHKLRFGLDAQYNNLRSTANEENIVLHTFDKLDTRFPDGTNWMYNTDVYFSHTWNINSKCILTDGIRLGYTRLFSSIKDTSVLFHLPFTEIRQNTPTYSGSLGFIYTATEDLKLSALIASGFRVPNADDLTKIFGSAPGMVIVPNTDLKPEKTINYELGITKVWNNHSRIELACYYTQFFDVAVVDPFTFNGQDSIWYDGELSKVFANQNKNNAYLYGFSTQWISQLSDRMKCNLSMHYTIGKYKTDTLDYPLDHIPPLSARFALEYKKSKFDADFVVQYNAKKPIEDYHLNGEDNEQYATPIGMPAWMTFNVHAGYQVLKNLHINTGIENILDTQYRGFASGINGPGRNIFISAKAKF